MSDTSLSIVVKYRFFISGESAIGYKHLEAEPEESLINIVDKMDVKADDFRVISITFHEV